MRILTGLQPSGGLHIGNFFGTIKPMIEVQDKSKMFIFIANHHTMTSSQNGAVLKQNALKAAAAFLSLGVDPQKSVFWPQNDVKEMLELYWILPQFSPMGLFERAHSYEDKVAEGPPSSHGLFSYPVLAAADILLFDTQIVLVGKDQVQHVEIARDIALEANNEWREIFILPEARMSENAAVVPGTDGAKMSKSYQNTVDIFASEKLRKKQVSSIVADSTPLEEPKNWRDCNIFKTAKPFLSKERQEGLKGRYERGDEGYGHSKAYLNELVGTYFREAQENCENYLREPKKLEEILELGTGKARKIAQNKMQKIYDKIGL